MKYLFKIHKYIYIFENMYFQMPPKDIYMMCVEITVVYFDR